MKSSNKFVFATVIALLAICTLAAIVSVANAQTTETYTLSVSSSNKGVNEVSTYTLTITNTGSSNLAAVNITVPNLYTNVSPPSASSAAWTANYTGGIIVLSTSGSGLSNGESLTVTFQAQNPITAGTYQWSSNAAGAATTVTANYVIAIVTIIPAIEIFVIAIVIAFLNSGVNRILVSYFIGWEQYRVMQKEMAEYRSETMAAARANDQKRMEKLKKKQSQINNMQSKMLKPQMIQIGISFLYILVWFFVLIPVFGTTSIAYLPGFGPLPVVWLYPIFSFFLALLSQRILGVNPIEP
jgi:Predicted membrane protein